MIQNSKKTLHMTVNFLYIFQITLYQIRNLIEKKKQSYVNKDSSNSGKSIQFDFCTNCILQMLKPISHVKIHRSWSTTCSSLVNFFQKALGSYSTLLVESIYLSKQGNSVKQDRMNVQLIATHQLAIGNIAMQKSVTALSSSGLRMHKMNISN